jgi:hypothetical protein
MLYRTDFPDSDALVWAEYDDETQDLTILLRNRRTYRYSKVPELEYDRLVTAESAGRYYNRYVRNDYDYREILPEPSPARPRRSAAAPPSPRPKDPSRSSRAKRPQSRKARPG